MQDENKPTGNKMITIAVILTALVFGTAGFFGGRQYQKKQRPSFMNGQFQMGGNRQNGNQARNGAAIGQPTSGEIVSLEDKTLTIKAQDGSSKIIVFSDSTKVNKTSEGARDDLKIGEQIMVIGTTGSDGTVTAQTISLGGNFFRAGNQPNE